MLKNIKNLFQKNNKQVKKSSNSNNNKDNSSKKKLLKVITIISYILSFVFIIIMMVSCFKSCNSSDSSISNNIPSISSKESKPINKLYNISDLTNTEWTISTNSLISINVPNDYSSYGQLSGSISFLSFDDTLYSLEITNNTTYYGVSFSSSSYYINYSSNPNPNWAYYNDEYDYVDSIPSNTNITINITGGDVTNSYFLYLFNNNATLVSGGNGGDSSESPSTSEIPSSEIPSSEIPGSINPTSELVSSEYEYLDSIVFSNNFDWRILLTNGYQENTGLFYCDSDYFNQIIFSGLEFVSNDKLYNRIVLYPVGLDMATSVIYTEYTETGVKQVKSAPLTDLFGSTPTGKVLCGLMYVTYEYWDNGSSVYSDVIFSCYEINWAGDNSSNKTVYGVNYNVPRWSSNNYKRLDIISKSDTGANSHYYPNITLYDLLTVNSNVSVASYGSFVDVFSLFASAFGGMTSIFAISVLPNITLGALLFLPLVVVLFITIIRLIKK